MIRRTRTASTAGLLLAAAACGLAAPLPTPQPGAAAAPHLEFVAPPQMLNCNEFSRTPCFRAEIAIVGTMLSFTGSERLAQALRVRFDDLQNIIPFYAAPGANAVSDQPRYTMILLDISGSMNQRLSNGQTRFEAAKAAAKTFLRDFDPKRDHVAVIPFESHKVVQTVQSTPFGRTRAQVERQIDSLPMPRGNTGLYAAVNTGLDVLTRIRKATPKADVKLLLLTDGRNEVLPGDDPDLSSPEYDLSSLLEKVDHYSIPIIAVGLGLADENDQMTLKDIGGADTHFVSEAAELTAVFASARSYVTDRLQIAFSYPNDKGYLGGRNHRVEVVLYITGGRRLAAVTQWITPNKLAPGFEGVVNEAEKAALLDMGPGGPVWTGLWRPALVMLVWACAILTFWFLLPRYVWPERYQHRSAESFAPSPPTVNYRPEPKSPPPPAADSNGAGRQSTDGTYVPDRQFNAKTRFR